MADASAPGPALGLLELCSVARGFTSCDAALKRAPSHLVHAGSTHPGKYSILLRGGVDEVFESLQAGAAVAAEALIDRLFLPYPHEELVAALEADQTPALESVGVLETYSMASTLRGADAALKGADVRAIRVRLARDLGGKAFFVFTGLLHDVEEAMRAGRADVGDALLAGAGIIANPHPDLVDALA